MTEGPGAAPPPGQGDYFANHARARRFPWTLYHRPLEADLGRFLRQVAAEHPAGEVLVVGCGLLHELDAAPSGLLFHVTDIDPRAVDAVLARQDPRIVGGTVVPPEAPISLATLGRPGRGFAGVYAKEVIEHVLSWPAWLTGLSDQIGRVMVVARLPWQVLQPLVSYFALLALAASLTLAAFWHAFTKLNTEGVSLR